MLCKTCIWNWFKNFLLSIQSRLITSSKKEIMWLTMFEKSDFITVINNYCVLKNLLKFLNNMDRDTFFMSSDKSGYNAIISNMKQYWNWSITFSVYTAMELETSISQSIFTYKVMWSPSLTLRPVLMLTKISVQY